MDQALLETTRSFHRAGITSDAELAKLTLRILGKQGLPQAPSLSPEAIRELRQENRLSQGVLAAYLGVSVGYLSRLERGEVEPSRPLGPPARHHPPQGHRCHPLAATPQWLAPPSQPRPAAALPKKPPLALRTAGPAHPS
jgi:putative transcriptional regulator